MMVVFCVTSMFKVKQGDLLYHSYIIANDGYVKEWRDYQLMANMFTGMHASMCIIHLLSGQDGTLSLLLVSSKSSAFTF